MRIWWKVFTFALVNVKQLTTKSKDVGEFDTKILLERRFLPKVTTSVEQQDFIYNELLPKMQRAGMIDTVNMSEFVRWGLKKASEAVGVEYVPLKPIQGRKPGKKRF